MNNFDELINTYLWFAYLPPKEPPTWLDDCMKPEYKGNSYNAEEASSRFDALFDKLLEENPNEKHIIPLSGGWDSRAILGALLERLDSTQIETVTFGVPGQLDYDIGIKIAKWAGVKSHPLDLRTVDFTWDKILDSVKKSPWTYVPDGYFNQLGVSMAQNKHANIWSGFLGDVINGGNLPNYKLEPLNALNAFFFKQKRNKEFCLYHPSYSPQNNISYPHKTYNLLLDDVFYFGFRCKSCIASINLPTTKWNSWTGVVKTHKRELFYITPFADESWAGYWLAADREHRTNQKLFFETMNKKFPELFSLPSKSTLGLPSNAKTQYQVRRIHHGIKKRIQKRAPWLRIRSNIGRNYVDYDEMFRKRKDYKETLVAAFDYMKSNEVIPWLNLDRLWKEHMQRRKELGDAFCVLIGLAANLSANGLPNKM
jgi:hypothetical protein